MLLAKIGDGVSGGHPLLPSAPGFAYDIHIIHYMWQVPGTVQDTEGFRIAMSTRIKDMQGSLAPILQSEIFASSGVHFVIGRTSQIGTASEWFYSASETIPLPRPWRVPYLAFIAQNFWNSGNLGVEVGYDLVGVSKQELAGLIIDVGGQNS